MATPKKLVEIALIMTFKICLNLFKKEFFSFVVLDILTSFLGLTMEDLIQDHNQGITKPNQAKKPFLGHLKVFLTYFLAINPQNPPEVIWRSKVPESNTYVWSIFIGPIPGQIH